MSQLVAGVFILSLGVLLHHESSDRMHLLYTIPSILVRHTPQLTEHTHTQHTPHRTISDRTEPHHTWTEMVSN